MGKGSTKLLIAVALVAVLALSWYTMLTDASAKQSEYDGYISAAHKNRELELVEDAIDYYMAALEMKDSIELREEISDYYKDLAMTETYLEFCEETMNEYPHDERSYVRMAEYYNDAQSYTSCFSIMNTATRRGISSTRLAELRSELQYEFDYLQYGYSEIGAFSGDVCAVKRDDGKWGYVTANGSSKLRCMYLSAGAYNGAYLPVQLDDGEFVFIDITGREKSKDVFEREIEACLYLSEEKTAVKYDGKYHYCDFYFNELFGSYDYAGAFNGGYAAVMNDDAWYLIDENGNPTCGPFEEIKVDEKSIAFKNGVLFAKKNGEYFLIDAEGNQVGDESWKDVDCFNSDQPAAVSDGNKWGFVNTSGELVTDYVYGSAKSFSNGFAAVSIQDKWGYIGIEDYDIKIEAQFTDAADFSRSGTAFVKKAEGWDMIKLYSYTN